MLREYGFIGTATLYDNNVQKNHTLLFFRYILELQAQLFAEWKLQNIHCVCKVRQMTSCFDDIFEYYEQS